MQSQKLQELAEFSFFKTIQLKPEIGTQKNLGFNINEWGSTFGSRNIDKPDEINYLQWSPFQSGSEYFAPSKKEFMVNYRVQNIEGLVKNLSDNGVTILDDMETFEYGKFIHIMDPEGNKIELWEPIDAVFTELEKKDNDIK